MAMGKKIQMNSILNVAGFSNRILASFKRKLSLQSSLYPLKSEETCKDSNRPFFVFSVLDWKELATEAHAGQYH